MKKHILIFLFTITSFCGYSATPEQQFVQANELYKKGQYDSAVVIYQNIIKQGVTSSELYYNLGNAYYKAKRIPDAILNYERAKKLSPNSDEINFNLQLANSQIVDKIAPLPEFFVKKWIKSFANYFSSNSWAIISLVSFVLALVFAGFYLFSLKLWLKKLSFWMGLITLIISLTSFVNSNYQKRAITNKVEAIVINPSVTVKSSPDDNGTDLFVIHEGIKVQLIDAVGEWHEIKLPDGNKGWLKISDIEKI
jgi:tetratricopeptide (TPR) repeat protein